MTVLASLLELVEHNPYPVGDTSSHWRQEGERLLVRRCGESVELLGFGIGTTGRQDWSWQAAHALERWSYHQVTGSLRAYAKMWTLTQQLSRDLSLGITFEVWKCAVILAVLTDHWTAQTLAPKTFALIGDGSGFLGALIRRAIPMARLYCVDLPKGLVFQAVSHQTADPSAKLARWGEPAEASAHVVFALPQEIEDIKEPIDCALNIASMQEMMPESIARYFAWLRRRSHPSSRFYCVNRQEKILPGGETIRFAEYPWQPNDTVFLDGPCPYYTHYLSRVMRMRGPTVFGVRVPFINYFDGPIRHRLVQLST